MKIKTSNLTGVALDWAVAKAEYGERVVHYRTWLQTKNEYWKDRDCSFADNSEWRILAEVPDGVTTQTIKKYSTDWRIAGQIMDREGISVLRLEDESIPDSKGNWQGKYEPRWGAVHGDRHRVDTSYGPQGDNWGESYSVSSEAVVGPTMIIAAMRCYVASKLGDEIDVPDELCQPQ